MRIGPHYQIGLVSMDGLTMNISIDSDHVMFPQKSFVIKDNVDLYSVPLEAKVGLKQSG